MWVVKNKESISILRITVKYKDEFTLTVKFNNKIIYICYKDVTVTFSSVVRGGVCGVVLSSKYLNGSAAAKPGCDPLWL